MLAKMIGPNEEQTLSAAVTKITLNPDKMNKASNVVESEDLESPPPFSRLNSVASMKSIDSRTSFQGIPLPDVCDSSIRTFEPQMRPSALVV